MSFSLVAHTIAGSTTGNGVTSPGINTSGANLIVLSVASDGGVGVVPVSDSNGNTWTQLTSFVATNRATLYYCFGPTVGAAHTFTASLASSFPSIVVQAWSGAASSPFDVQNGHAQASTTSIQVGSVTPGSANELVITGITLPSNPGLAINTGFTITDQTNLVGSQHYGAAMAYLIQTTATPVNPTWSWTSGGDGAATIATFKSAAAVATFPPSLVVSQAVQRASLR